MPSEVCEDMIDAELSWLDHKNWRKHNPNDYCPFPCHHCEIELERKAEMADDKQYVIIDGVAYFMNLFTMGKKYNTFDICIGQLSDEIVAEIEAAGLVGRVKTTDPAHLESLREQGKSATDMGKYITIRSRSREYFTVTDTAKNPIDSLPFGSKVRVMAIIRPNQTDPSKKVINLTRVILLERSEFASNAPDPYDGLPSDSEPQDNEASGETVDTASASDAKPWLKDEAREEKTE